MISQVEIIWPLIRPRIEFAFTCFQILRLNHGHDLLDDLSINLEFLFLAVLTLAMFPKNLNKIYFQSLFAALR